MTNQSKQPWLIWWILWVAFQTGIVILYGVLGSNALPVPAPSPESLIWLAGLAPFFISTNIRWVVLPRAQSAQTALPLFILGMALAEATCFLGLFLFQAHKQELFALSVLGIFQFIPAFARRYFAPDDQHPNP